MQTNTRLSVMKHSSSKSRCPSLDDCIEQTDRQANRSDVMSSEATDRLSSNYSPITHYL